MEDNEQLTSKCEGSAAASTPQTGTHQNVPPKFDPSLLLNPRSPSVSQGGSKPVQQAQTSTRNDANYGSLIERVHNVETRTEPIARKRRVESEEDRLENKKIAQLRGTNSGIVSDHLKQRNDEARPTQGIVDLTAGLSHASRQVYKV